MQNIFKWLLLISFLGVVLAWVFYQPEIPRYYIQIEPKTSFVSTPILKNPNTQIETFQADVSIILSYKIFKIPATALLFIEKPQNFRLVVNKNDKEMDLGSNESCFWYWTKKEKNTLFYGNYADYPNIDLKAILNPIWIMESLGLHKLENFNIFQTEKYLVYSQKIGKLSRIVFVQKDINAIVGTYIIDEKETIISSIEIIEFYDSSEFYIPKKILILWPEENIKMEWHFNNIKLNGTLDKNLWEKPYLEKETNLKY